MQHEEEITYKTAWANFNKLRHLINCSHFTDRLKERYGIEISKEEYFELKKTKNIRKNYKGYFKSSPQKSVGTIDINGTKVWCIYDSEHKLFVTVLPKETEQDIYQMIYSFFRGKLKPIALEIYKQIEFEVNNTRYDFNSDKEAALHYYGNGNCNFPSLCMDKYKHKTINKIKACHIIASIITGQNEFVSISLKKKETNG